MQSEERKQDQEETPNVNREEWNAGQVAKEATNKPLDETVRETLRGDETDGDADERDIAGGVDSSETPHGREETKNNQTASG